jgi:hypothetical protein
LAWDHANSEVKVTLNKHNEESFTILILSNSVEFEGEMKLRLSAAASSNSKIKIPSPMYVGKQIVYCLLFDWSDMFTSPQECLPELLNQSLFKENVLIFLIYHPVNSQHFMT